MQPTADVQLFGATGNQSPSRISAGEAFRIDSPKSKGPSSAAVPKFVIDTIARSFADLLLPDLGIRELSDKNEAVNHDRWAHFDFACHPFASDRTALARVTVYWPGEGSGKAAAWNGARLREIDCAVDPKKIPYGSRVIFRDGECMATDTGPDVVNRKAARSCGRTTAQRNAIVIDRFFESKEKAIAWERAHPRFMMVRVLTADAKQGME